MADRNSSNLARAIQVILALGASQTALAQSFQAEINVADLNGANGFVLNGEVANDRSGVSVSAAGDVNGDGIDDLLIGANDANPNGNSGAGRVYVVFGSISRFPAELNLSSLDGTNGFVLNGEADNDSLGSSVSAAGDLNDDGIDDLVIGARTSDIGGNSSGRSYVVFGSDGGFSSPLNLSDLNQINGPSGVSIGGENAGDNLGRSVSRAGDINDDGIDDIVLGAFSADGNANASGRSYVIFGSETDLTSPVQLSGLDGTDGFVINGINVFDNSGRSVSAAGDINGDGIDDLILGTPGSPYSSNTTGRSYILFGSDGGFSGSIALSDLSDANGFVVVGTESLDYAGHSVSVAGDINSDGIDDIVIGAYGVGNNAGAGYVVFGSSSGFSNTLELSSLDGMNGFSLVSEQDGDRLGFSVSAAGDVNGDGIDDLIIGAREGNNLTGRSYVVFGSDQGFGSSLQLSSLDGSNGFSLNGEANRDDFGYAVSDAGDINGDGVDDLIIGARNADPNGAIRAGRSYVIFGRVVDLAVSKTNNQPFVDTNAATTWTIEVSNPGGAEIMGAVLTDTLPAEVDAGTATWTCQGFDGASCPNIKGNGSLNETIDLPAFSSLRYELTAQVIAMEPATVTNTATISLPKGRIDINPDDNSATDSDPVGLFVDGFEAQN